MPYIRDARPAEHRMTRIAFGKIGVCWLDDGEDIVIPADQELTVKSAAHGAVPKIDDAPWPGFPSDLVSIALTVATYGLDLALAALLWLFGGQKLFRALFPM